MAGLGAPIPAISLPAASGPLASPARDMSYHGFTIHSTGAVAPVVRLWQGGAASGVLLDTIGASVSGFGSVFYERGIRASGGIYVEVVQGTFEGSVRAT